MSSDDSQSAFHRLARAKSSLSEVENAIAAARTSSVNAFLRGDLAYDTSYGSFADCVTYLHFGEAYLQAAQAELDAGDLDHAETHLGVASAYLGSAGDCLDEVSGGSV